MSVFVISLSKVDGNPRWRLNAVAKYWLEEKPSSLVYTNRLAIRGRCAAPKRNQIERRSLSAVRNDAIGGLGKVRLVVRVQPDIHGEDVALVREPHDEQVDFVISLSQRYIAVRI